MQVSSDLSRGSAGVGSSGQRLTVMKDNKPELLTVSAKDATQNMPETHWQDQRHSITTVGPDPQLHHK